MNWGQWWGYRESIVSTDKDDFGVYQLIDGDEYTVYYGSGQVKTRLLDHLNKKEFPTAEQYRVEYCSSEAECKARKEELLQAYKNAHGKLPRHNERIG